MGSTVTVSPTLIPGLCEAVGDAEGETTGAVVDVLVFTELVVIFDVLVLPEFTAAFDVLVLLVLPESVIVLPEFTLAVLPEFTLVVLRTLVVLAWVFPSPMIPELVPVFEYERLSWLPRFMLPLALNISPPEASRPPETPVFIFPPAFMLLVI